MSLLRTRDGYCRCCRRDEYGFTCEENEEWEANKEWIEKIMADMAAERDTIDAKGIDVLKELTKEK